MNAQERLGLLADLETLAQREAENVDPLEKFLPVPSHRLALRSEIVVVRGGRGAGKSALFRLLERLKDPEDLREFLRDKQVPTATWIDAFSQSIHHPEVGALDAFSKSASDTALRAFWMAHLLNQLQRELSSAVRVPANLEDAWKSAHGALDRWVPAAEASLGTIGRALDEVERILEGSGRVVFAAYDHLDRIGAFDPGIRRRHVSVLLALWLSLSNRYRRLRAKIFLRDDLFDAGELGFPDASKLRPRSVSIDWDVASLYRVAIRHLANTSADMREWLSGVQGLDLEDRGRFGWMPGDVPEEVQKAFADRFAGRLMGRGVKKGYTYRWIPNRLQDSQVRIVPRSMLCLLGFAGREAKGRPLNKGVRLVTSQDLVAALEQTSRERVAEIKEELALVQRIENLRGLRVPLERQDTVRRLGKAVTGEGLEVTLDGEIVFDELVRLGVLSVRIDGRIDVPDIYRYGYGILRKGGVQRPR